MGLRLVENGLKKAIGLGSLRALLPYYGGVCLLRRYDKRLSALDSTGVGVSSHKRAGAALAQRNAVDLARGGRVSVRTCPAP